MNADQFQRVMQVFDGACSLLGADRVAFLDRACESDPHLRAQVEAMIAADRREARGITPIGVGAALIAAQLGERPTSPDTQRIRNSDPLPVLLGDYRIVRIVGEGGMGVVYEAEQASPRRAVALKAIRPGSESQQMLRRFRQEAELLGRLQHPGIAQIYEAGSIDADHPSQAYFAMELVDGLRLTDYAEKHRLTPAQRIELLCRVCDAVQHAHERGVIHRDLKPSNILVVHPGGTSNGTQQNGDHAAGAGSSRGGRSGTPPFAAQPKILDFGVARSLSTDPDITSQTLAGELIGTLTYMSPEQIGADPREVGTRSDVYALGVILHELLTGRPPFDLAGLPLVEVARVIREQAPPRLGVADRRFRGDLETIAAMALHKEKSRRYNSPAALAADLRRYLRGEPIEARAPETLYLLSKLIQRNRGIAAAMAGALMILVAGIAATSWQAANATQQRHRAESAESAALADARHARLETAKAQRVSDFFRKMLASADPSVARGREVTIRGILDNAAESAAVDLADTPDVQAAVRDTIGETYRTLALYPQAEAHLRAAVELRRNTPDVSPVELATSLHNLSATLRAKGDPLAAAPFVIEALELRRRELGPAHAAIAASLHLLAELNRQTGNLGEAEAGAREALDMLGTRLGVRDDLLVRCTSHLGTICSDTYRFAAAERLSRQALELARELHGIEHPLPTAIATNLGSMLNDAGRPVEAEPVLRAALVVARQIWGDDHPDTARLLLLLSDALIRTDRGTEAEPLIREGLEIWERKFTRHHRSYGEFLILLAEALLARGDAAGLDEAELAAAEAVRLSSAMRGWITAQAEGVLGSCVSARGDFAAAEPVLLKSYEDLRTARGTRHRRTHEAIRRVVSLYVAWRKPDEANKYRSLLPEPPIRP